MPLEIEKKFLLSTDGIPSLALWPVSMETEKIAQVYLVPHDAKITSERVRMSMCGRNGDITYTHTTKVRITDGVHEEENHKISESKYSELLYRLDPGMSTILKTRCVFTWENQVFELDVFAGPLLGLAVLEIELTSMGVEVKLPPWLRIEREVTAEPGFTNAALARKSGL